MRAGLINAALLACLAAACLAHLSLGALPLPPSVALEALLAPAADDYRHSVLRLQRLPRLEVALFAGAALAVAGFLLQKVLRNPLVSPSTLGLSGGASLAVVATLFVAPLPAASLLLPGTLGAVAALAATLGLSRLIAGQGDPRLDLVLAGAMVSMLCGALVTFLVSLDPVAFAALMRWLVGDIAPGDAAGLPRVALPALAALGLALLLGPASDPLLTGEDQAAALGLPVGAAVWGSIALAVVLAVAAIAVVGPIGFLGLVVPHLAKLLLGEAGRGPILACLILGPLVLTLADLLARTLRAPQVMITGTVMGLAGGAVFLALLLHFGRGGRT